jgi:predicted dehydrogenase
METKKFAVIGCEHAHIEIFVKEMLDLGHHCSGIYEPNNLKLAKAISEKFHIPIVHDREKLLADVKIVGSSAINNEKITLIEQCEKLGKHIMVDKPAVTNRRDYDRLQALMNRNSINVGMLLTERFHPAIYTLKKQIDQGALGEIVSIGMRKPHLLNAAGRPAWFFSKEQCGGIVIDLLVHDFDLLRWFTGSEVVQTEGYMVKRILPEYPNFYDLASVQVLMEGNITAQLYADWFTPVKSWTWGDGRIFVTGTNGFAELRLSGDPLVKQEALFLRTTSSEALAAVELEQPPVTITKDFLNRIEGKPSLLIAGDILSASQATIQADEQVRLIQSKTGGER